MFLDWMPYATRKERCSYPRRGRCAHLHSGVKLRNLASLSLAASLVLSSMSFGQKPKTPNPLAPKPQVAPRPAEAPPTGAHELTAADLEAFLDGVMPLQLRREDIAGAVISVVKDGKPLFAKGYGFADVAKRMPVSPDSTLFRPGSLLSQLAADPTSGC